MRAVVTRVKNARVDIAGETVGETGGGFLVLLGVAPTDTEAQADRLADKVCGLRVFEDENGKMNRNLEQVVRGAGLPRGARRVRRGYAGLLPERRPRHHPAGHRHFVGADPIRPQGKENTNGN